MNNKRDFLIKKSAELAQLQAASQSALDVVTTTIDGLRTANDRISAVVAEIQEYKAGLSAKENELVDVQNKNSRIIENFSRLIED